MARSTTQQSSTQCVITSSGLSFAMLTASRADERFGESDRAYLSHIAKSLSMPLLAESSEIWSDELSEVRVSEARAEEAR